MSLGARSAKRLLIGLFLGLAWPGVLHALVIDFEDAASLDLVDSFETQGFTVTADALPVFLLNQSLGGCVPPVCPDNGTFYVMTQGATRVRFARSDGRPFDLLGFDVAESMILEPDPWPGSPYPTIEVTGFRADGSRVERSLELDGRIDGLGGAADFETVVVGAEFTALVALEFFGVRTEIPLNTDRFAIDNLRIVPEPGTALLVIIGLAALSRRSPPRPV
jgi:hypothetical protein